MKIAADLDPDVRNLPINLTEAVEPPENQAPINTGCRNRKSHAQLRPDLEALRIALEVDDWQIEQAANLLRPDLELTGNYTLQGLGGIYNYTTNGSIATIPGGFADRARTDVRIRLSDLHFWPDAQSADPQPVGISQLCRHRLSPRDPMH